MAVWFWGGAKGHIVGFGADPKGTLEPPKGTVPFGKGLARTLMYMHRLCNNSPFRRKQKYAWNAMIVRYIRTTFRPRPMPLLHRLQCKFCYIITVAQRAVVPNTAIQRISHENLILACHVQVVPSLDCLPTQSYSASKLTIHFACTSVAKPKEVS